MSIIDGPTNELGEDISELTTTGWVAPPGMSFADWRTAGETLIKVGKAWQWWLGDWATYGQQYGSKYDEAMQVTGLDYQALADCVYVAHNVAPEQRREDLSWTHHKVVAPLPPDAQEHWLSLAVSEGMTVAQLREAVAVSQREELPPVVEDDEEPEAKPTPPPTIGKLFPHLVQASPPEEGDQLVLSEPLDDGRMVHVSIVTKPITVD